METTNQNWAWFFAGFKSIYSVHCASVNIRFYLEGENFSPNDENMREKRMKMPPSFPLRGGIMLPLPQYTTDN